MLMLHVTLNLTAIADSYIKQSFFAKFHEFHNPSKDSNELLPCDRTTGDPPGKDIKSYS